MIRENKRTLHFKAQPLNIKYNMTWMEYNTKESQSGSLIKPQSDWTDVYRWDKPF